MARTSIATDNFNRASLGTADWSQMNTGVAGDVQIDSSTRAKGQFGTQPTDQKATARWIGAGTFTNDQYASIKIVLAPSIPGNPVGVCVRASGSAGTRTLYEAFVDGNVGTQTTSLNKWVSGTRTVLYTDTAITWAANDLISLEAEGTTLRVCKNGTPVGGSWTLTDASISTGVPGITVAGSGIFGDDWEGGNVGTAALTLTPSLFTNSSVSYGPTVAPGVVTLTPSLFSNTNTFFTPSVSWTQSLAPGLFSNTNTFYASTVVRTPGFLTPVMKNNTRTVLANETGVVCNVYNASTGALVVRKTGLTSDASGIVSVTDAAMVAGTTYAYDIVLTGGRRLPVATA